MFKQIVPSTGKISQYEKNLFIPSNFVYSFYVLQGIWNTVTIRQIWIYINIQIII